MSEIELFEHLTVYKEMTGVWLDCQWYKAILGTIYLCWLMLRWIVRNRTVWSFDYEYQQNLFTNIFNLYVKTGFSTK